MKQTMTIWYAVSKSGQGRVFTSKPERDGHFGIWVGESIGFVSSLFLWFEAEGFRIENMAWQDEPKELTISIEM